MEIGKKPGYYILTKLSETELYSVLKSQIDVTLVFRDSDGFQKYIDLGERRSTDTVQDIAIIESNDNHAKGKEKIINYDTLLVIIKDYLKENLFSVEISQTDFKKNEPLIYIWKSIKLSILKNCCYIGYNDGVFSLINMPVNKLPEKCYYFEDSEQLLVFSQNGPQIINNITSIEDILCD
jgi:hypothetical protein